MHILVAAVLLAGAIGAALGVVACIRRTIPPAAWLPLAGVMAALLIGAGVTAVHPSPTASLIVAIGTIAAVAVASITTMATDTQRREVIRLRRLAEARADQVTALSHEIRTPLAMVHGAAELLYEGGPGPLTDAQLGFVSTIRQQSTTMIDMAEGLLVQARIEAQLFDLHLVPLDLRSLVRTTVRDMQQLIEQRAQRIVVHCPPRMERMDADGKLLRQALVNLLQNASRHTSHGGAIEVRVLDNDDDVVMSVLDDGDGMSSEDRARLFQRFASGRPLGDGTGLGMVITKQIAELHGGRILVDTQLHRGTTVMISLPRQRVA